LRSTENMLQCRLTQTKKPEGHCNFAAVLFVGSIGENLMHSRVFQRTVRLAAALIVALVLGIPAQPLGAAAASAEQSRPTRPPVSGASTQSTPTSAKKKTTTRTRRSYSASASRARRARLARARAEVRAREARELQTPRFRIDDLGQEVPDPRAEAAIIYNPETNQVLWESNAQDQRSIASITKVMTALVFLESGAPLATPVNVVRGDVYRASTTYLRAGYQVTADDLMNLLLIGSDNAAARALARVSPYGAAGFVDQMNQKAAELGLEQTHYADPSGLLASNVSSAYDMARLIAFASADERIGTIMRRASHTVQAGKRTINVSSTNQLVKSGEFDVLGGKTGFISRSGYCVATLLRLPQSGQQVAVVVLGAKSNQGRFWETRHLFNWLTAHTQRLLGMAPTQPPAEAR
jgi:serine-type D-Ala-D-Ala endopeptidase (penicillin-binding protein 7)